ncbi:MAG TPA: glycosyltransferase family 39 protein [Myxococcota bacterium]|nr:glycosyltransferase family 39 protein [Myxococcota bacterium]
MARPNAREWGIPAALALVALVARCIRWGQTAAMMNDGPEFIRLAQAFAAGDWRTPLSHPYHPLYPAAVSVAHGLIPDWERAAVAVSVLAGAAAVWAVWALVRQGFPGRWEAAIAAFLLAVQPVAIELADVQSDALYLCLFVASAAALLRGYLRESSRAAAWAGLFAGLAYLTRPEGVGTVLVGLGLAGFHALRGEWPVARAVRLAAPLCVVAGLVMAPYVAYISLQAGRPTLTAKKSVTHMLGVSKEGARPAPAIDALLAAHPELTPLPPGVHPFRDTAPPQGAATLSFATKQVVSETSKALRPEGMLLLALGIWLAWGPLSRRGWFFAAYSALYLVVVFALAATSDYLSRRHVLPPVTLLLGYEALGVQAAAGWLRRAPPLARPLARAPAALLLAVAALGLGKSLRPDRLDALPERRAAEWVRLEGGLGADQAVASIKRRVGYYAGARFVDLRQAPHPALVLEYLRRERVRYVIVDAREREELLQMTHAEPDAFALRHHEALHKDEAFVLELRS